jgi:hypothetical protein
MTELRVYKGTPNALVLKNYTADLRIRKASSTALVLKNYTADLRIRKASSYVLVVPDPTGDLRQDVLIDRPAYRYNNADMPYIEFQGTETLEIYSAFSQEFSSITYTKDGEVLYNTFSVGVGRTVIPTVDFNQYILFEGTINRILLESLIYTFPLRIQLPVQDILWTNFDTSPAALSSNGGRTVRRTDTSTAWSHASANTYTRATSGKWYFEVEVVNSQGQGHAIGVAPEGMDVTSGNAGTSGRIQYHGSGQSRINGGYSTYGTAYVDGDIVGIGYSFDDDTIRAYLNGVDQGIMYSGANVPAGSMVPYWSAYYATAETTFVTEVQYLPDGYLVWN